MKFISIDIENNQPSGKVIQLGACAIDTETEETHVFHSCIEIDEPINWQHPLNNGQTLGELLAFTEETYEASKLPAIAVYTSFWQWVKDIEHSKKIVQWGTGDLLSVIRASEEHLVRYPNRLHSINAKHIYRFLYRPAMLGSRMCGLDSAMRAFQLEWDGPQHDALVDAIACGEVYKEMFNNIKLVHDIKQLI